MVQPVVKIPRAAFPPSGTSDPPPATNAPVKCFCQVTFFFFPCEEKQNTSFLEKSFSLVLSSSVKRYKTQGWRAGSADNDTCLQTQWPEFDTQDPHDRRRKVMPTNCPLTSTHSLWHPPTHTQAQAPSCPSCKQETLFTVAFIANRLTPTVTDTINYLKMVSSLSL